MRRYDTHEAPDDVCGALETYVGGRTFVEDVSKNE